MSKHFLCSLLVCFSVFYGCGSDNPVTAVTPSGGQTTPGTGDAGGDPTKDNAYVFGTSSNGTLDIPGFWKKGSWVGLKNELDETKESLINDAGLFGTDYYIAGGMLNATDVTIPVYWKNGTYVKLVNGVDDQERFNAEVSSIIVASNVVYAGGYSLTTTDTRYHERCPGI